MQTVNMGNQTADVMVILSWYMLQIIMPPVYGLNQKHHQFLVQKDNKNTLYVDLHFPLSKSRINMFTTFLLTIMDL